MFASVEYITYKHSVLIHSLLAIILVLVPLFHYNYLVLLAMGFFYK